MSLDLLEQWEIVSKTAFSVHNALRIGDEMAAKIRELQGRLNTAEALVQQYRALTEQKPVAFVTYSGDISPCSDWNAENGVVKLTLGQKLYAAPVPAPQPAQAVPDGWQLVPVCPTENQMQNAAFNLCNEFSIDFVADNEKFALAVYSAMLAAAPQPVAQQAGQFAALLIREIEACADVMEQLGSLDPGDIDCDTFEYVGETPDGRDCRPDLSITGWAARTAKTLNAVMTAQEAQPAQDEQDDELIEQVKMYIERYEEDGDKELAAFFVNILGRIRKQARAALREGGQS